MRPLDNAHITETKVPQKLIGLKISLMGFLILAVVTVVTGITVYVVTQRQAELLLGKGLQVTLQNGVHQMNDQIQWGLGNADMIATRPSVIDALKRINANPEDFQTRESLNRIATSFISHGFTGVAFFSGNGQAVARAGHLTQKERFLFFLNPGHGAYLLRDQHFILHVISSMRDKSGHSVGSVETEAPLTGVNVSFSNLLSIGSTSEIAFCGSLTETPDKMDCVLDTAKRKNFRRLSRRMNNEDLPASHALNGEAGLLHANDYLGKKVIAAFSPIDHFSLGLVLKMQESELYGPLHEQLKLVGLLVTLLVLSGGLLLYWMVNPLVRQQIQSQQQLLESRQLLLEENRKTLALLHNASDGIHILDPEGHLIECSDSFCTMLGYSRDELIGMHVHEWDANMSENELKHHLHHKLAVNDRILFETRHRRKNGETLDVEISSLPVRMGDHTVLFNSSRDITERKRADDHLRLVSSVFHHADEGILITDAQAKILEVNPAFSRITGYGREEVLGQNPRLLHSGQQDKEFYDAMWKKIIETGHWSGEVWNRRKNGEIYPERLIISSVKNALGETIRFVALFSDISDLKNQQRQLEHMAHHDALTGLPNRSLLNDRLNMAIALARRSGHRLAVCFMDLDGFKPINDTYGHDAGDLLLIEVARRLLSVSRSADTVARLGGDEFILLFCNISDETECRQLLQRILETLTQPFSIKGNEIHISASMGVVIYPDTAPEADGDTLLRFSDQAMYVAKQSGRQRFHFFEAMREQRA